MRECDHPAPCGYFAGCVHQSVGWREDTPTECGECGGGGIDGWGYTCRVCGGTGTVSP
jgi:hypothetical protein